MEILAMPFLFIHSIIVSNDFFSPMVRIIHILRIFSELEIKDNVSITIPRFTLATGNNASMIVKKAAGHLNFLTNGFVSSINFGETI